MTSQTHTRRHALEGTDTTSHRRFSTARTAGVLYVIIIACGLFADPDVCAAVCTGRDASPRTPPTYTEHAADCLDAAQNGGRCDRDAAGRIHQPGPC